MLFQSIVTTLLVVASAAAVPLAPGQPFGQDHQRQPVSSPNRCARDTNSSTPPLPAPTPSSSSSDSPAPISSSPNPNPPASAPSSSTPVLPVQTPNTLPPVSPGVNLRVIALGVGTQNYSCSSTPNSSAAAPVSIGARANLFEVTSLFVSSPQDISNITEQALLANNGLGNPLIGEHYFTYVHNTLTPTFDLSGNDPQYFLSSVKDNTETAPVSAYKGMSNEGAVPWLFLTSDSSGLSSGVSEVYRVETAGGLNPSTCEGISGEVDVPYSAEYWFFG